MALFTPTNLLWFFGHLFLLLIGSALLGTDHLFNLGKAATEGIGASLVAAGVTGEILFLYVLASDSTRARLELFTRAGLLKVFPHRSVRMREEYDGRLKKAREIDILGFGQSSFRQDYSDQFKDLSSRALLRILLIDPSFPTSECSLANLRDLEEGNSLDQIRKDVEAFINTAKKISGLDKSRFKIRLCRTIPSVSVFRIDNVIFWGPYFVKEQSRNSPTILVQQGPLFDRLKGHFDQIWSSEQFSSAVEL